MRTFAWRTHAHLGAHLLDQRFDTPEDAGLWRADTFPGVDGTDVAPLTLVAVVDGETESVTPLELHDCHMAWLHPGRAEA